MELKGNDNSRVMLISLKSYKKRRTTMRRNTRVVRGGSSTSRYKVVHKKVRELQRLIPGGEGIMSTDTLFVHTADYILQLRLRLHLLQALSSACPTLP
ncbi:hypothetical protein Drorol1_Dr00008167, partial [Drosera rotundifolia]